MTVPALSIVSVNWNVKEHVLRMIDSVPRAAGELPYEIIIVDNDSSDGSVETLRETHPEVLTIRSPQNLGFSRANNLGFEASRGDLVAFVNPDVELSPKSLEALAAFIQSRPLAGMVGPRIDRPNGETQSEPGELPSYRTVLGTLPGAFRLKKFFEKPIPSRAFRCGYLHGSCFLFRRRAYEAIGRMPTLTFMYGEEILMGVGLAKAGFDVWYVPEVTVTHQDDASANKRWTEWEKNNVRLDAYARVMREVLSPAEFNAWNAIMASRAASTALKALLSRDATQAEKSAAKKSVQIHLDSFRGQRK